MPRTELQRLLARLAAGEPPAGVLLLGGDAYLREQCRASLVEALVPEGAREWGTTRLSVAEAGLDRVLQQAQTRPMLAACQVVFAEQAEAIERLDEGERDAAVARLEAYLDDPAPFTLLVLEAAELDQRMRLFRLLSEKTLVVGVALDGETPARQAAAARLAVEMAGGQGVRLEPSAASALAELVEGDLLRVRSEVDKLAAYVGARRQITPADVDALVVSERKYSVWQLAEVLAGRQRDRALEFLDGVLREGEEPAGIVGALAWMYRTLIQAQELPRSASVWDAVRELRVRRDTAEMALAQARRIPRAQLLAGLQALYEADSRLKSGPADARAVLEFLLAELTAPALGSTETNV